MDVPRQYRRKLVLSKQNWPNGTVLVLGAQGMLGHALARTLRARFKENDSETVLWGRTDLDICDEKQVLTRLQRVRPSVVLNAAAYTDVDGCETDPSLAAKVNTTGAGYVAAACAAIDAVMVHVSTDFVFDGTSNRPYRPADAARPLSIYGQTKWDGERAVRAAGCHHLIVRTSWLFGSHGRNFVDTILAKARQHEQLAVVSDQIGAPTLTDDLAGAVVKLLDSGARETFHFVSAGECSWFDFAKEIVLQGGASTTVNAITSAHLARPARRPAYSVLDTSSYTKQTGQTPPSWQDALRRYLENSQTPDFTA